MPEIRVARIYNISRGERTERLYKAEEATVQAVKKVATNLMSVLYDSHLASTYEGVSFYDGPVPDALASTLESFELKIGTAAAMGYLLNYYTPTELITALQRGEMNVGLGNVLRLNKEKQVSHAEQG